MLLTLVGVYLNVSGPLGNWHKVLGAKSKQT